MPMRYFKGRWDEDRGDEFAVWGCSDWYFEVQDDNTVVRQIEVYASGVVLRYDQLHPEDRYGMLTDQPFDATAFPFSPILRDDFEQAWSAQKAFNR